jgi:dienelactone hydrolase
VLKIGGAYLMWYGSYWTGRPDTTALGFAVSLDGMRWYKHPRNPVFRPDPDRPWESHYVTSQSIMRLPEGGFRIWYASRSQPPFVNKYYAINTACWLDPPREHADAESLADLTSPESYATWQGDMREQLRRMLGIPRERVPLEPEPRGQFEHDGIVVEKWVFTAEPGSRVPAVLYRPKSPAAAMPAIVLTFGHGGSKSQWQYNYAGQLYARLGLACLALDPIGEEERHIEGRLGTRAHDPQPVHQRADRAGRLIMGKLIFDTMRGIDLLCTREDIDHDRIGVAGNSLGGAKASWMAALEPRIKMAIVSGWSYSDLGLRSKYCTKVPNQRMRELLDWPEYAAMAAPCAVLVMNGDADVVIDTDGDGTAWTSTDRAVAQAARVYTMLGETGKIRTWYESGGGHRPYMIYKEALVWIHEHLGTPGWSLEKIRGLKTINSGQWCDRHGIRLESLYGIPLHQRGASLPDLGLCPIPREKLSCLNETEKGSPEYTLEGWLQAIDPAIGDSLEKK